MESINKKVYIDLFNSDYRPHSYAEWNAEKKCFVARVDKFEAIIGEGATPEEAIDSLEKTFVAVHIIFEPEPQKAIWFVLFDSLRSLWIRLHNFAVKMVETPPPKKSLEDPDFKVGMTIAEEDQKWDELQRKHLAPWNFDLDEFEKSWRPKEKGLFHATQWVIPSPGGTKLAVYFNATEVRMGFCYGRLGVLYGNQQEPKFEPIRLVCSTPDWLDERYIIAHGFRDGEESQTEASFVLIDTARFCFVQVNYGIGMVSKQHIKDDTLYVQITGYNIRTKNRKYKLADLKWRKCERLRFPES